MLFKLATSHTPRVDVFLPQTASDLPLMMMGNVGKVGKYVSVGKKGLTEIAKKMHLKDITTKIVGSRNATEAGFKALTVNMYKEGEYIGTMHQVINPATNKVLHRDLERLLYRTQLWDVFELVDLLRHRNKKIKQPEAFF
jgi:hypothetical protein